MRPEPFSVFNRSFSCHCAIGCHGQIFAGQGNLPLSLERLCHAIKHMPCHPGRGAAWLDYLF
jgi:hypothetical protein